MQHDISASLRVAEGGGREFVTGREASSRTIGIAPRINKYDRIKVIVHLQIVKTS
jgi:hypothetical protein